MKFDKKMALNLLKVLTRYQQLLVLHRAEHPGVYNDPNFEHAYDVHIQPFTKQLEEYITSSELSFRDDCPCGCCDDDEDAYWSDDEEDDEELDEDFFDYDVDECISASKFLPLPVLSAHDAIADYRLQFFLPDYHDEEKFGHKCRLAFVATLKEDSQIADKFSVKNITRRGKTLEIDTLDNETLTYKVSKFPKEWTRMFIAGVKYGVES